MKRAWVIPLLLCASFGCRNSQPATNPFLRTTVAPPATGDGAVVLPAEPYAPGAAPPAAVATPPPGAVPVTPAPAAAVPVVPPRDPKYSPPGGSYLFHQSSLEETQTLDPDDPGEMDEDEATLAAVAADAEAAGELRLGGPSDAIEQALALSKSPAPETLANYEEYDGELPDGISAGEPDDDEPLARPLPTAKTVSTGKRVFTARSRDASAPPRIGISPSSSAQVMAAGADEIDEADLELDMPRPDGASVERSAARRPQRSFLA